MSKTEQLVDLGEVLTKEGREQATVGQVFKFNKNGKITRFRVIRINKAKKRVWAERVKLYTRDEADKFMRLRRIKNGPAD